ncbi:DUF4362 domain-containing protein [Paenibacillus sp. BR2-3]|uniref:DUF4362 domain-containing protein n=1 Tax=Paenibacillus sp. BR2-3 TaxID=3048494 RepID=UPI0039778A93
MIKPFILLLCALAVTGCNSYSLEDAKKNGDIITGPPGEINPDKIDGFMKDVENGQKNKIRITSYTIEGEPILNDLYYRLYLKISSCFPAENRARLPPFLCPL